MGRTPQNHVLFSTFITKRKVALDNKLPSEVNIMALSMQSSPSQDLDKNRITTFVILCLQDACLRLS